MDLDIKGKLRALPLQVITIPEGLILKRGLIEVHIGGHNAVQAVRTVLDVVSNRGATIQEILLAFDPADHPTIKLLITHLSERRLLVPNITDPPTMPSPESNMDIFHWQFGQTSAEVQQEFKARDFVILGVNWISRRLLTALQESGLRAPKVIDDPALRNQSWFDNLGRINPEAWPFPHDTIYPGSDNLPGSNVDCVIATSDFGYSPIIRDWNRRCVQNGRRFFPILLHNMEGQVGPLIVPNETACFECLLGRRHSHLERPELHRAVEAKSIEGQAVSGFHPCMASIVAEIAAFELIKSYSPGIPARLGNYIEVALLAPRMTVRKVLKLPRCPVCSPLNTRPSTTLKRDMFTLSIRDDS